MSEVESVIFAKLSREALPFSVTTGRSLSNLEFARHAVAQCYIEGQLKPIFLELSGVITDDEVQVNELRDRVIAGLSDPQIILNFVSQVKAKLDSVHPSCEWSPLIID
jgi:hypothetical protein